jgi:hypothetical protein
MEGVGCEQVSRLEHPRDLTMLGAVAMSPITNLELRGGTRLGFEYVFGVIVVDSPSKHSC